MTVGELAAAFEAATGCALRVTEAGGVVTLLPEDERLGAFGLLVGRPPSTHFPFRTRSYGAVELVLYGDAKEQELDRALRTVLGL